jgi:FtsP/CotA-like multicopper oxidase with cupredoxin domain
MFSIFFLLGLHTLFTGTDCKRVYYSFEVEHVPSNPDGYPIPVIRVCNTNTSFAGTPKRAFPGPIIRAQKGDTVVLKIHNKLHSEVTSIHFHGLHQYGNPWMDGVAGVTQPDIPPMSSFTYRFKVTQTGTFWYHSHSGHQIASGLLGPIILDYPDDELDPIKESYPYQPESESIIILQDWHHERGDDLFTNYRGPYNAFKSKSFQPNYPWSASSILMNGRGQFDCSKIGHNECVQFYGSPCIGKKISFLY